MDADGLGAGVTVGRHYLMVLFYPNNVTSDPAWIPTEEFTDKDPLEYLLEKKLESEGAVRLGWWTEVDPSDRSRFGAAVAEINDFEREVAEETDPIERHGLAAHWAELKQRHGEALAAADPPERHYMLVLWRPDDLEGGWMPTEEFTEKHPIAYLVERKLQSHGAVRLGWWTQISATENGRYRDPIGTINRYDQLQRDPDIEDGERSRVVGQWEDVEARFRPLVQRAQEPSP